MAPPILREAQILVFGSVGSDAGYWVHDANGWHHVGGWAIDKLAEVRAGLAVIAQAPNFKTPGLANAVTKDVAQFVQKQLAEHLGEAGKAGEGGGRMIIIIGG
jgi:hypothetical protein